ncbi:Kelch-like protein 10 [Zootermopsis nevadensis]|uniref:Kelch-like protein 10 n=1 Tax=Zootermopsis nevadensis TaxID=136037 RepID=A0A067QW48_ZOONE|nr:Kelch-like protein 10 [Zootermopsis nevadensis]
MDLDLWSPAHRRGDTAGHRISALALEMLCMCSSLASEEQTSFLSATSTLRAKTKTDPLVPVEDEPLLLLVQDNTASKSSDILRITPEPPVHAMDRMTDKFTLLVQGLSRTALTSEFAVGWLHYCADLETHARRFILSHFVEMSEKNKELLELSAEELQAIIGSDKLNMKEERFVWECILRWVNHDQDIRKGYIAALSKGVRLGLIDKYFVLKKEDSGLQHISIAIIIGFHQRVRPVLGLTTPIHHMFPFLIEVYLEMACLTKQSPAIR